MQNRKKLYQNAFKSELISEPRRQLFMFNFSE